MKRWWNKWRKHRRQVRFWRGFNYAAGKLLMTNGAAREELEQYMELMRHFGDYDSFDAGVKRAIELYGKRMQQCSPPSSL